jgi:hypothetical protein
MCRNTFSRWGRVGVCTSTYGLCSSHFVVVGFCSFLCRSFPSLDLHALLSLTAGGPPHSFFILFFFFYLMVRQFTFPPTERRPTGRDGRTSRYSHWHRYNTFYGLAFTTTLSTLLLLAELREWRVSGNFFRLANRFPASVALVVQMLAAFFGLLHVAVITKLSKHRYVNYCTFEIANLYF